MPAAEQSGGPADRAAAPPSRFAALRAQVPTVDRPHATGAATAPDDEPSVDDPDIEGSGLVGPSVVAQVLGSRVIEERND